MKAADEWQESVLTAAGEIPCCRAIPLRKRWPPPYPSILQKSLHRDRNDPPAGTDWIHEIKARGLSAHGPADPVAIR
jgi:hypothetical protein